MNTYLYQVNVTRACNLRCTHCYIDSKVKQHSGFMTKEGIIDLSRQIKEHVVRNKIGRAEIHIVGGEPTMLGLEYFEKTVPEIRKNLEGIDYELILVSNLLSSDILDIAKKFDKVSTSYEPDTRFFSLSKKYKPRLEETWRNNVHKLVSEGIDLSATVCITKGVVEIGAKNILDFLVENFIKQIHLGFYIPQGDGLFSMSSNMPKFEETAKFLCAAADWYFDTKDCNSRDDVYLNPIESLIVSIDKNEPKEDIVCPIISGSIDINWDGNAVTCLEEGGSTNVDWSGNVFSEGLLNVTKNKKFMKRVISAKRPNQVCVECPHYEICLGGCGVLFEYWNGSGECPGFKSFIEYMIDLYNSGKRPKASSAESLSLASDG